MIPAIEFRNVEKSYGALRVLADVSHAVTGVSLAVLAFATLRLLRAGYKIRH